MKKLLLMVLMFVLLIFSVSRAQAPEIELFAWGFNIDGTTYCLFDTECNIIGEANLPASMDVTNFDFLTGLGSIEITFSTPGDHVFISWLDIDIDFFENGAVNETGAVVNLPPALGQTWEIDEPGAESLDTCNPPSPEPPVKYVGDIFDNFLDSDLLNGSLLDNKIYFDENVPCTLTDPIDDVSTAIGWDFELLAGETAIITMVVSDTVVPPGFHLVHTDPDSPANIYISSDLVIKCQPSETRACDTGLSGVCADGTQTCDASGFWGSCVQDVQSSAEICDNLDNDCNNQIDDEIGDIPNTCGQGACSSTGILQCLDGAIVDTCVPGLPSDEICDAIDNDCDGLIDEDLSRESTCGSGICAGNTGVETCVDGVWGNDTCDPVAGAVPEVCDGLLDEDCDGLVDEGCEESLKLMTGWNLISLPFEPVDTNIENAIKVFTDSFECIWAFINNTWKVYPQSCHQASEELTTIEAGSGYWIQMTNSTNVPISGLTPDKTILLNSGWNLVGLNSPVSLSITDALASISGKYISVWAYMDGDWKVFDPENPELSDLTEMTPGFGYWINTSDAVTWTLP